MKWKQMLAAAGGGDGASATAENTDGVAGGEMDISDVV